MKSLEILLGILDEAQTKTCASMTRDKQTIVSRYEEEGESFLGITLPLFSSWLEESLELGRVSASIFPRFRKRPKGTSVLPCFLHGLTCRIFDSKTGERLLHLDTLAVDVIRQICLWYKKVFKVCGPARDFKAKKAYQRLDSDLRREPPFPTEKVATLNWVTRRFFPTIDLGFAAAIDDESILPRHGPGATADKAWANEKYRGRDFYRRWDPWFSWEHLYGFSTVHQSDRPVIEPKDELPVKVVSVPKTMKTSRIICVEPTAMQFAQQLTASRLVQGLQRAKLLRHLNFNDQSPNQRAARSGSLDGRLATLDLSEASDRVSVKLVTTVFRHSPLLLRHLLSCRSTRAVMQDGSVIHLRKYASMGSALTFPVEATCFLMICIAAVCDQRAVFRKNGRPKSLEAFETCRKDILVFGDDIVVPSDCVVKVMEYLTSFGLKVNIAKSFFQGPFRESCGHDYVNGVLVTPVYLRQDPPSSPRDASSYVSWVHMANRFAKKGWYRTAHLIADYIDKMRPLPVVPEHCAGLGWHFDRLDAPQPLRRWNSQTNTSESYVLTYTVKAGDFSDELSDYDRLLFFHLNRGEAESYYGDPTRSPKRNSIKLRLRKVILWAKPAARPLSPVLTSMRSSAWTGLISV